MLSQCGIVNEGCPDNFYSPYSSWSNPYNGVNNAYMHICAFDGSHELPGDANSQKPSPCAGVISADFHNYQV